MVLWSFQPYLTKNLNNYGDVTLLSVKSQDRVFGLAFLAILILSVYELLTRTKG
jgi:hypothetical protein